MEKKKDQLGFIAEEVAGVNKTLVAYDEDGVTPRSVKYDSLHALTVKELQKHQQRIEEYERRLIFQGGLIEDLLKKIDALEQQVNTTGKTQPNP